MKTSNVIDAMDIMETQIQNIAIDYEHLCKNLHKIINENKELENLVESKKQIIRVLNNELQLLKNKQ